MLSIKHPNIFYYFFLASIVILSKEYYITNEETLIAFCFTSLVVLLYYNLRTSVSEELDARGDGVAKEFLNFSYAKKHRLSLLISFYSSFYNVLSSMALHLGRLSGMLKSAVEQKIRTLGKKQRDTVEGALQDLLRREGEMISFIKRNAVIRLERFVLSNLSSDPAYKAKTGEEAISKIENLSRPKKGGILASL